MPSLRSLIRRADPDPPISESEFWTHIIVAAALVLLGGVFAGLTLGLMGLDELHLRVLSTSSDNLTEKRNAKKGTLRISSFPKMSQEDKF